VTLSKAFSSKKILEQLKYFFVGAIFQQFCLDSFQRQTPVVNSQMRNLLK
jgi:hypothetical protein